MADLQNALFSRLTTALSGSIGTRAYWSKVPQGAAMPYLRMQTVSDPRPQHLQGYQSFRETRVQVDIFSRFYGEARGIAEGIIAEMADPKTVAGVKFGRVRAEGPRDLGEDVEGVGFVHRLSLDLLAWHSLA